MIIKGSSRGGSVIDVQRLARHLLAKENEVAVVLDGCNGSADLAPSLAAMRGTTLGTRSRRALYHASISLPADEAFALDDPRWTEAVDCLERHLGLEGHQRVVVGHCKKERRHVHVVWCRAHAETLRIASDSHSYRKHEAASRELEERWACRPVVGVHTREPGTTRPVAKVTHADWQAQTRTGIQVADVSAALTSAWASTATGPDFAAAAEESGLYFAVGRRGVVVVDGAGTPHSIPRRLGLRAETIQERLADLDINTLPTVEACQKAVRGRRQSSNTRSATMPRVPISCQSGRKKKFFSPLINENRDYWIALGYAVERSRDGWLVRLSRTTTLVDAGDLLTLERAGEPTDAEILAMVTAARARGWETIRFFGGSDEFQRRARAIALKEGYPLSAITLACEEHQPRLMAGEIPKHIRDRLNPPAAPEPMPVPPITDIPTPTQEMHP